MLCVAGIGVKRDKLNRTQYNKNLGTVSYLTVLESWELENAVSHVSQFLWNVFNCLG